MNKEDVLVCITNYNSNENALSLKSNFSKYFETIIIDSKSNIIEDGFDIKLENVFYTGLFNESVNQCKIRNKKYLFFIASDVYFEDCEKVSEFISNLNDDVYLWAPSSRGQSHQHCKNKGQGLREVPYLEGFCFLSHIECCKSLYPISLNRNKFGYGIDLLLGHNCIKIQRKKCLVDDRIEIYHKEGTGYDQGQALHMMYDWMGKDFNEEILRYTILYSKSPGHEKLLDYLKN